MDKFLHYIYGQIQRARNANRKDIEVLLGEVVNQFKRLHPELMPAIVEIEGWKGIGKIDIFKDFNNDFIIKEYIKNKETGDVEERKTEVAKEDVNNMLRIIRDLKPNVEYRCYYIANKLGWMWKELWKERRIYFQIYYYPIKCLEALEVIDYFGRGSIMKKEMRLK